MSAAPSGQASIGAGAAGGSVEERAPAPASWSESERRLNIRVFEYWDSLLKGRDFPSVADLDPEALEPFRDNSLLIDFTDGYDNPKLRFIGKALRQESGIDSSEMQPDGVPRGTMLSRLTDHYLEILANRAPIGFEAEFTSMRGVRMLYRGILLPMSDDGETINFIYGAVSWKDTGQAAAMSDDILDLDASDAAPHEDDMLELTQTLADEPGRAADSAISP
ncbi:MAG: PAS domain-containing protein, partial [Alphaproteobacteria bacterium]